MTITQIGAWLMLASGGLFAGGVLIVAVERTHLWRHLPVEQYATDFRRTLYRVDPLLPILSVICGIGAVLFALTTTGRPAVLTWIAVALIAVIIVSSIIIAEPINTQFRRVPEGQQPERADQLRTTWRTFHLARTLLALAAFACLAAATS